jgi:cysteine desulfurase
MQAMQPYFCEIFGNPMSVHAFGRETRKAVENARAQVAKALGAQPNEIYFTGCGTESDNWAVRGAAYQNIKKGKHIITTTIEHHAILHTCEQLEKEGFEVTYLPVDEYGLVTAEQLEAAIRPDTTLVSIMAANNEIGTLQPIKEAARLAHQAGALMFTDAVQAMGAMPIKVDELGVDLLSFSGHKLNAPKGIGGLYIRRGVRIDRFVDGGGQESGRRGGTENVPYIMALAKAMELSQEKMADNARLITLRDRLIAELTKIPYSRLNGHPTDRLPGNVNITFQYIEGEGMLLLLDQAGICVSTGSACSSASLEPSHVLVACGVPIEDAHGSLRISLGHQNTEEDVEYIIQTLPGIVQRLRDMSPIYPGN